MPVQLFSNNAQTTLAAQLAAGATSMTVATGEGAKFRAPTNGDWEMITLTNGQSYEIVKCTARTGDNFTIVRAQEGTSASQWEIGETVSGRATRGGLELLQTDIIAAQTDATSALNQLATVRPDWYDYGNRSVSFGMNLALGKTLRARITGDLTITLSMDAAYKGAATRIILVQDGVGGHTVTINTISSWNGGLVPVLSTGADKTDILGIMLADTVTAGSPVFLGVSYALGF